MIERYEQGFPSIYWELASHYLRASLGWDTDFMGDTMTIFYQNHIARFGFAPYQEVWMYSQSAGHHQPVWYHQFRHHAHPDSKQKTAINLTYHDPDYGKQVSEMMETYFENINKDFVEDLDEHRIKRIWTTSVRLQSALGDVLRERRGSSIHEIPTFITGEQFTEAVLKRGPATKEN